MPKPAIIDLTSDDEDSCLIKCSLDKTKSDQTFESNTINKSTLEAQSTKNTDNKAFTDFKLFSISSENLNGDVTGDVTRDDVRSDVKVESIDGIKNKSSDVIPGNITIKDIESDDKKRTELETAVEMLKDQNITDNSDNTSPSHVTSSVSEVTKQEEMETDPCMREQSQKPSEKTTDTSRDSDKPPVSDSVHDNGNQDLKGSIHDNINHEDKPSLQGNSCHSDGGSARDNNCPDNSCLDNKDSLQTSKISNQGSSDGKTLDVNRHHGDDNGSYGNKNNDNHSDNKNDTQKSIEDDNIKDGNLGNFSNCQPDDVTDSSHGNKETIVTNESQEEHSVDNDESNDCGVDFELRMEIDESMDSIDGKESDTHSDRLSGKSFNLTKTAASDDDSVPPLMSADDLSKIAAQIHQADEEPPKLTKMQTGSRLTGDLHDTIAKLQVREPLATLAYSATFTNQIQNGNVSVEGYN